MPNDRSHGRDRFERRFSRRDADLGGQNDPDRQQSEWEREAHPGGSGDRDQKEDLGFQRPDWSKSEFDRGDQRTSDGARDSGPGGREGNDFERF